MRPIRVKGGMPPNSLLCVHKDMTNTQSISINLKGFLRLLLKSLIVSSVLVVVLLVMGIHNEKYSDYAGYIIEIPKFILFGFYAGVIVVYLVRLKHNSWLTNIWRFIYLLCGSIFVSLFLVIMYAYEKPMIPIFAKGVWDNEFLEQK